jgi:hypothetical protein
MVRDVGKVRECTATPKLIKPSSVQENQVLRQDSSRLLVDNAPEIVTLNVVATYLKALKTKATGVRWRSRKN